MDPSAGALRVVVREAARFDRAAVSPAAGLLAAVPVVAVLGGGIEAGDPVAGVTMAAGAMLVGIAWRLSGGRPPLVLMAIDAVVMAASTFLGSITGPVLWLHLVVLLVWSLAGGLLAGSGNRAGVVGTQSVIAVIVFGRFGNPAPAALGLAGLVLAGGAAQVLFQSIVRWPPPLRLQRRTTAIAYRELAKLARDDGQASSMPVAAALDAAEDTLSSPTLFGDLALARLRVLVNEGRRVRISLVAIRTLLRQRPGIEDQAAQRAQAILERVARRLERAASAIEGASSPEPGSEHEREDEDEVLSDEIERLGVPQLARPLESLAGQVRAVASLAPLAGAGGGLRSRRPRGPLVGPRTRLRAARELIAAGASLRSSAGRHAVRLAVVVPLAAVLAGALPLARGYWVTVAAATALRPEYTMTFRRGIERVVGTSAGVALAGAIAVTLHPAGWATVALVGLFAWGGYATFPASFAVGFAFLTALIVFLLETVSPSTLAIAGARLLDTVIGGALGLVAYALWPTWSESPARQALADLVAALRDYAGAVLAAEAAGEMASESHLRSLARAARRARIDADSAVAQSLQEPASRRIDARRSQGVLSAARRLVLAVHVLRLEVQEDSREPLPALRPLADDLRSLLSLVESALREVPGPTTRPPGAPPDLRGDLTSLRRTDRRRSEHPALAAELDEIVDAANGLAALNGLNPAGAVSGEAAGVVAGRGG